MGIKSWWSLGGRLGGPVDCWLHVYEGCVSGVKTCGRKWSVALRRVGGKCCVVDDDKEDGLKA
jgi:hypothetical protein